MARQWSGWRDFDPAARTKQAPAPTVSTPGPGKGAKPGQSKYRNVRTEIGDVRFPSLGEAKLFIHLLAQKRAGEVLYFLRQVPFHLPGGVVYRLDFLVAYPDGKLRFLDFKGAETPMFRLKKTQVEALYPINIECIRRERGHFVGL